MIVGRPDRAASKQEKNDKKKIHVFALVNKYIENFEPVIARRSKTDVAIQKVWIAAFASLIRNDIVTTHQIIS